jgi:uncharacterized damage-inducible protein DinB
MSVPFPEPTMPVGSRTEVFLGYLDYFRAVLLSKVEDLPEAELRRSRLPSGWTPIQMVKHLTHVERRWVVWGFQGQEVGDPWADHRDGRWYVAPDEPLRDVVEALRTQAATTNEVVRAHDLAEVGQPGERWAGADPASLERVLFHLVQEYARHAGHVDVVRELVDGRVGE